MSDERKLKSQLIEELAQLRQRVARFEQLELQYKRDEEALRAAAFMDELTGLYNRKGFLTLGQQQINLAHRTKHEVLLVFMDLDSLKIINDSFGHTAGDMALVDFAGILKRTFRESDIISRWGGDEFVVVALANDNGSVDLLTGRLKEALMLHNLQQDRPYKLSAETGVAVGDAENTCDINELLHRADELMYQGKSK